MYAIRSYYEQRDHAREEADALDEGGRQDRVALDVAGSLGLTGDGLAGRGRDLVV